MGVVNQTLHNSGRSQLTVDLGNCGIFQSRGHVYIPSEDNST